MFSAVISPASLPCWTWAGHILEGLVALGVVGESYSHLIPDAWLPPKFRSEHTRSIVGKWSTVILAVAIVLVVPVGIVKEIITDRIAEKAAGELARVKGPRNLSDDAVNKLTVDLKPFGSKPFTVGVPIGGLEPESRLDRQILSALLAAGWRLVPARNKDDARGQPAPNNGLITVPGIVGVKVFIGEARRSDFFEPSSVLIDALKGAGIAAELVVLPASDDIDPNAIHIRIGAKT